MRWREKSSKRPYYLDFSISQDIIYDAYREGYINWNVFQKAKEKIKLNMNESWMFETGSEKIDFGKEYSDDKNN